MIKICMLLNGPIKNDHRVIKTLTTLSKDVIIDLFYINGETNDHLLFENNIFLHSFDFKNSFKRKLTQHSLIGYEFNFFINKVVRSGKSYDYIWANDLPTLYPAYKIANKLNSKLVYDSHEIYIETLNQFFSTKPSFVKSIIFSSLLKVMKFHGSYIEKKIIKESHYFITVNDSLLNYFKKKHEIKNTCVVMNFPYLNKADFKKINLFEKNNWDNSAKLLLYQGVINKGRGLEIIINTLKILPDNFKLIIIGDGPIKKELKNLSLKLNLSKRIDFINKVSINELLNYTSSSHLGINLLENYTWPKEDLIINELDKIFHHQEAPFGSSSIIAQWEVMKKAKEQNVTVLLDGQGADETLAGYYKYFLPYLHEVYKKSKTNFRSEIKHIEDVLNLKDYLPKTFYLDNKMPIIKNYMAEKFRPYRINKIAPDLNEDFIQPFKNNPSPFKNFTDLNSSLYFDTFKYGLGKLLRFSDRNSMAFSREVRLPYLSHELVEFIFSSPSEYKMNKGWSKKILRHSMNTTLPNEITWRKDKKGFQAPSSWMKNKRVKELIKESSAKLVTEKIISKPDDDKSWQYLMSFKLLS